MGEFDFTYSVPANFNKRVVQFLQQFGKAHVAQAFQRCEYEYEDLGLAYYAGMKGDNWNKNALDFTFEGAESDIALLQSFDSVLQDAIGKALKASESGLLVRKVYYFASDSTAESTMIPPSNEERLNADMAAAQSVLDDLIQVGERVCLNARDMLSFKGYNEVKDQTRHGISASGKDAAEVDILLTKAGREIAIFEGLKLDSVSTVYIDAHIDKAIVNYNALGTATFLVAYVNSVDFESFWKRYSDHVRQYDFPLQIKRPFNVLPYPNAAARVATLILTRDGFDFPVYFIAFKIS